MQNALSKQHLQSEMCIDLHTQHTPRNSTALLADKKKFKN